MYRLGRIYDIDEMYALLEPLICIGNTEQIVESQRRALVNNIKYAISNGTAIVVGDETDMVGCALIHEDCILHMVNKGGFTELAKLLYGIVSVTEGELCYVALNNSDVFSRLVGKFGIELRGSKLVLTEYTRSEIIRLYGATND